jgi:hypothetical protein
MATNEEKEYLDAIVSLGCIVCMNKGNPGTPAEVHHLKRNPETGRHIGAGKRSCHLHSIPLCPVHHRHGGSGVAYHAGPKTWEAAHGTEAELWLQVQTLIEGVCNKTS